MTSRKKRNQQFSTAKLFLIVGGTLALVFFCYIIYRTYQSDRTLISIMIVPLILGIIVENKRLSSDWNAIALKILGALLFSFFVFLPGKREKNYEFENHIEMWPYWFVFMFVLFSMIFHEKKIIPKMSEGTTLLQSISIVYWIIDFGILNYRNVFTYILMIIGIAFCLASFIHAFSYIKLTRKARLFLSIWSSIIMIIFAVDHIYRVFNFNHFVDYKMINDGLNILQYFLLGVSLIYIFKNVDMLLVYLPERYKWYNKEQMRDIRKMNETHIDRYSSDQIKIVDAIIALLFTSSIYYWNYRYQIMPRHTLIWLLFLTFPVLIWCKELITKKIKTTANR